MWDIQMDERTCVKLNYFYFYISSIFYLILLCAEILYDNSISNEISLNLFFEYPNTHPTIDPNTLEFRIG